MVKNSVSKMCIKRFTVFDVRNDICIKFTRLKTYVRYRYINDNKTVLLNYLLQYEIFNVTNDNLCIYVLNIKENNLFTLNSINVTFLNII